MMEFINTADFEEHARKHLPKKVFDYYRSGATEEQTLQDNIDAFRRIRLRPRILKGNLNCSHVDISTSVLGHRVKSPILVAPTAMQKMAHPLGEIATAKACEKAGVVMCLSSLSTTSIEEVASCAPDGLHWFQLYIFKNREISKNLVLRAEAAGYKALILTVDTPILGRREADVRNGFALPSHLELGNFQNSAISKMTGGVQGQQSGLLLYMSSLIDPAISWADIAWLRSITKLPIVVKGIHCGEDARLAVEHGVSGIWVSNHGGRQLDGVLATIDILPEVVAAVKGRAEIYFDGGIRRGISVFKALALGATAVFLGRPVLWALASNGEEGVSKILELLNNELASTLVLSGCASLKNISPAHIAGSKSLM